MASQALLETRDPLHHEDTTVAQPGTCEIYSLNLKPEAGFLPWEELLGQLFGKSPDLAQKLYRADLGTADPAALSEILQTFLMTLQLCESVKGSRRWFETPCALLGGEVPAQLLVSADGRDAIRAVLHGALLGEFELHLD